MYKYIPPLKCQVNALIIIAFVLCSCHRIPNEVNNALIAAGKNKSELTKVIEHYQQEGDEEKLKATFFLIENMPSQTHYEGVGVSNYKKLFSKLLLVKEERKKDYETIGDSLKKDFGPDYPGNVNQINDITTLKSAFLITHIDAAFAAWKQPWARDLTFDQFCEYLLPYKLVDEEPVAWNSEIQGRYKWLTDSMAGSSDSYKACLLVNNDLKIHFTVRFFPSIWDVSFKELDAIRSGKCYHATQYTAYIMRAMGIPVAMDYTPLWGNMNGGHKWDALLYHQRSIPFIGSESDPGRTKVELAFQRRRAKVFRRMYSIQKNSLVMKAPADEEIPEILNNNRIGDVTSEYIPVSDLSIHLDRVNKQSNFAYLCVFNFQNWQPVYWGEVNSSHHSTFKDMGRDIVYLPAYYDEGRIISASPPVILKHNGDTLNLDNSIPKKQKLVITQKGPDGPNISKGKTYELFYWNQQWVLFQKQTASSNKLTFNNVPDKVLFWLHNSDKSTKERVFTNINNKLQWW